MTLSPHPNAPDYKQQVEDKKRGKGNWQANWGGYKSPEARAKMQEERNNRNAKSKREL